MKSVGKEYTMIMVRIDEKDTYFKPATDWCISSENNLLYVYNKEELLATFSKWDYVRFV